MRIPATLVGVPLDRRRPCDGRAIADRRFAADLAAFLAALQAIDPTGGPPAGAHSFSRGAPLEVLDEETRTVIAQLAGEIDAGAATAVWEAALAAPWQGAPTRWLHGDVTGSNLLVADGRLAAVIHFGCCAVGDPSCDLAIAWTLFHGASRRAFRDRIGLDEGTWSRGAGWALWKALTTLAGETERAATRFGWRVGARRVVDEVLDDPAAAR
jgi:aminoglycoside phosphotransferase (APT) family kinase protein